MNLSTEPSIDLEQLILQAEQLVERRNTDALQFADKAMDMAIESGNPNHFAHAKYIQAFYHCLVANNYDKSIELCHEALACSNTCDISDISYKMYMTLGNSYLLKGEVFAAQ